MRKNNKNLRKKLFAVGLSASMLLSTVGVCFAKIVPDSYTYPNTGYTMEYSIGTTKVGTKSGAFGITCLSSGEDDVYAFVSIFSYKNGNCKNSASSQTSGYAKVTISGNGGNAYKSFHALKDSGYDPIGKNRSLTVK